MKSPFSRDGARSSADRAFHAAHGPRPGRAVPADERKPGDDAPRGGLRVVVLPAFDADAREVARALADHGHDVTLLDWCPGPVGGPVPSVGALPTGRAQPGGRMRRLALLVPHRPDTWLAVGRRLRGVDAIVVPEAASRRSPARRLVVAVACGSRPRGASALEDPESASGPVVVHWPTSPAPGGRGDLGDLTDIGSVVERARRPVEAVEPEPGHSWSSRTRRSRAAAPAARATLRYSDIRAHSRPSAVLVDTRDADRVRRWTRRGGLRGADPTAAWDAAGGLAALLLADRGDRSAVLVDRSGPRSPMRRWAARLGFDVVGGGDLVSASMTLSSLDVAAGSVDVVTQLHPALVSPLDIDVMFADAAWLLRAGGMLVVTIALVASGPEAFGPAELRAVLARAHDAGLTLVGDVDDLGDLVRDGRREAAAGQTYGLIRLALRRRG